MREKEQWVRPEMEELDIAEKTQSGDGVNPDGIDPSFVDDGGGSDPGGGGGGGAPSS